MRRILGAVLAASTLGVGGATAVAISNAVPAHAAGPTALINADQVSGTCSSSFEATLAAADGLTVTCVDGATWDGMTKAQFENFNVLVVGDPTCSNIAASVMSNVGTWTSAVMETGGNRFTIGSDPVFHAGGDTTSNRAHIVSDGIAFAGALAGKTGAYVDTTCEASSNNTTILNDLSVGGTGWSVESPACAGNIGIVATNAAFSHTADADLSDWFCSSHSDYPTFAADWVPFAVSADAPTQNYCANDIETKLQVCGEPYILLAGGAVTVSSNISLSPVTATNPVGTSHTVTATVVKGGTPEAGKTVTFSVSAGPNAGATGSGVTNAAGQATFTYSDTGGAGTDTIVGSFIDDAGAKEVATASKTWEGTGETTTSTSTTSTSTTTSTTVAPDRTPPTCVLSASLVGPPKAIQITVGDTGSGLKSIVVTTSTNATTPVPAFTVGTTSPTVVTATKINQKLASTIALRVTDVAGNVTNCDPTLTTLSGNGSQTVSGVDAVEHYVTVGTSGLAVTVTVNGHAFSAGNGTLDVASAMTAGTGNTIVLSGSGSGSASVLIWDGIGTP